MPDFGDFVDELKAAGVVIEGETIFLKMVRDADDWTRAVCRTAAFGSSFGFSFHHQMATRGELANIVRGYPFETALGLRFVTDITRDPTQQWAPNNR